MKKADSTILVFFLRRRTLLLLFVIKSCVATARVIPNFYIPVFFQFMQAATTPTPAMRISPFAIVSGTMLISLHHYVPWDLAARSFNTVGGALFFALLEQNTPSGAVYGFSILLVIGTGLVQQCAYPIANAKVPDQITDAIGFINNTQIGSVVVLTFTSLIFQNAKFQHIEDALAQLDFT